MVRDADAPPRFSIELTIDGVTHSLKPFIHEMIGGAVMGLVQGLKGVDDPRQVTVRVERVEPKQGD